MFYICKEKNATQTKKYVPCMDKTP